ncbi:glycoside hydrolase family 3 protein, partial [Candidatus Saccharibacteria bacterium]|nr:glycoside hydrolase family 3 protein [Candidatus Saccharibacteria bacterium]
MIKRYIKNCLRRMKHLLSVVFVVCFSIVNSGVVMAAAGYNSGTPYLYPFYIPEDAQCSVPGTTEAIGVPNSFTEDQRIAQTFIVGFTKDQVEEMRVIVEKYKIGGVLILGNNGNSVFNSTLFSDLNSRSGVPLLVASDEEGGSVQRFKTEIGSFPSAHEMGAMTDTEVQAVGKQIGEGLAGRGVNVALAPVVDLSSDVSGEFGNSSVSRTFSTDPAVVARKAAAFASGLREAGVSPTFKHFPGLSKGKNTDNESSTIAFSEMTYDLKPYETL